MVSKTSVIAGLALTSALALSACGSDSNSTAAPASGSSGSPASGSCGSGALTAAGSTAQNNAMTEWIKAYQATCPAVSVNYQSVGSGAGIQSFLSGQVDFAGSDSALKPEEHPLADKRCATGTALDLPMVVGPIAIAYNLPGVKDLVLDAPTAAKIFSGKITTWNDPAITALNPGASLPSTKIAAFHRSDESGTTDNVQKYLTAAAPTDWTYPKGKAFGAPGGQAAKGSDGVAQGVKSTTGGVGYMELSFAENSQLGIAKIATGAGSPVALSAESAGKAVEAATVSGTGNDLSLKLDYATKVDGAYPIVLVTYEIACEKGSPADKLPLVKGFLTYTSSTAGQKILVDQGYAPLPESIRAKVATAVSGLS
jgi:phosphate transport system substrate-binding protein